VDVAKAKQEVYGLEWGRRLLVKFVQWEFVLRGMHGFALNVNADLGYFDNIIRAVFEAKRSNIKCEN
jgi:hypothetical protein